MTAATVTAETVAERLGVGRRGAHFGRFGRRAGFVEAVALSSFGGLVGIAGALAASLALRRVLGVPFVVDATIVAVAFLFSAAVGMVFGYFPARKAARLDPIEALRHE